MGTPRCLSGPRAHFYWPTCATFTGHCAAIAPIPRFRPSCAPIFLSATRKRTLYCRLRPATSGCLFRRSSVEDANRYGDLIPCRQTCEGSLTGRQDPWQSQHTSTLRQRKRVIPTSCRWLQSLHPRPVPSRPVPSSYGSDPSLRSCSILHVPSCPMLPTTIFGAPCPNQSGQVAVEKTCLEKIGSCCFSGDRKRWTGSRSRTLAPPRGAAWIVDRLEIRAGDEPNAWDACSKYLSLKKSFMLWMVGEPMGLTRLFGLAPLVLKSSVVTYIKYIIS
jgi:hypothetical protein